MTIINTCGAVAITDSVFEYNSLTSVPGGGGLHVVMLQHHHHGLKMQISECNFTANSASAGMDTHYYGRPPQFARGGGIAIQLFNKSHSNDFTLQSVKAFNNTAISTPVVAGICHPVLGRNYIPSMCMAYYSTRCFSFHSIIT